MFLFPRCLGAVIDLVLVVLRLYHIRMSEFQVDRFYFLAGDLLNVIKQAILVSLDRIIVMKFYLGIQKSG